MVRAKIVRSTQYPGTYVRATLFHVYGSAHINAAETGARADLRKGSRRRSRHSFSLVFPARNIGPSLGCECKVARRFDDLHGARPDIERFRARLFLVRARSLAFRNQTVVCGFNGFALILLICFRGFESLGHGEKCFLTFITYILYILLQIDSM